MIFVIGVSFQPIFVVTKRARPAGVALFFGFEHQEKRCGPTVRGACWYMSVGGRLPTKSDACPLAGHGLLPIKSRVLWHLSRQTRIFEGNNLPVVRLIAVRIVRLGVAV
jgi:hypothetical protein